MAKTAQHWGASSPEWETLIHAAGIPDLLPVVSNLKATISPDSKIAGIGKTPSHYNNAGLVAGMPKWTETSTTAKQVAMWRKQPDYGICIQTRNVRALDIDVPDLALSKEIVDFLQDELTYVPMRYRENSGKCLLAVRVEGVLAKRILCVKKVVKDEAGKVLEPAWNIEFLANGQQFIAAGTHTSGARYQWEWHQGGQPRFPSITEAQFEKVWDNLVDKFGVEDAVIGGGSRKKGERTAVDDEIAGAIEDLGLALGFGKEGQIYIDCPWKDGHSGDTGVAQTTYFPKGSRGYEQGHFHCLHASCSKHNDGDFISEMGLVASMFPIVAVEDPETGDEDQPFPKFIRNDKGDILAVALNVAALLARPDKTKMTLRFDTFRDEIMWSEYGKASWRPFSDEHNTELRIRFDRIGFKSVSKDLMRDCVHLVATQSPFDSAVEWLGGLAWDGVPRIGNFAHVYFGTEDSAYTRAVSEYMWSALAGRVLEGGVKADMAPILVGAQGARKSSAVAALSPHPDFFGEIDLSGRDADLARLMRGRLVGEIAELQGLKSRDLEAIKAFIPRTHEKWVPKFKEFPSTYPRRLVFIGTSNDDQFLSDSTGNRRWLPMRVVTCDPAAIIRDRDQLWAEAAYYFQLIGIDFRSAENLARAEHGDFRSVDDWEDVVAKWLNDVDDEGVANKNIGDISNSDIMQHALGITPDKFKRSDGLRVHGVMSALGYEKGFSKSEGAKTIRVWRQKMNT